MNWYLIWGLGAALAWGTADYCAKHASEEFGFWPTVWGMNAVGAVALGIWWAAGGVSVQPEQWRWLGELGVGNPVGGIFFYYALEFGPLVLVSPITAAYPVVSAVLAFFISGERLGPVMLLAVGGVIAGTLLASMGGQRNPAAAHPRRTSALWAAVGGALVFGTVFYFLAAGAGASGTTAPVLVFRWVGAILLALPLLTGRGLPLRALIGSRWLWATGLLDSFAYVLYATGARHLQVSVVSALSGLFSVWTLVLAVMFLRERLGWRQWWGVGFIFASIALLAIK